MTQERQTDVATIGAWGGAGSHIDASCSINGVYRTSGDLRVEGAVEGEVACSGTFTLEAGAIAEAKVNAAMAVIRGSLQGELTCPEKALLSASAVVDGTIKAATLVIEEGARFKGDVEVSGSAP